MEIPVLRLKKGRHQSILRKHPWVFSGALQKVPRDLEDGATVYVADHEGHILGTGHYHRGSIAVRLFAFEEVVPDAAFWADRIGRAIAFRQKVGILSLPDTDACRLVHGEGDGLSGLVVDRYSDVVVLQCHSIGMHRQRHHLAVALQRHLGPAVRIYDKSKNALPPKYAAGISDGWLVGEGAPEAVMREYGHQFYVHVGEGQKTGFFLDQRENRRYVAAFCEGRTVLNAFCYSGGFSVYALARGASHVASVDASARAIEWTERNVALNELPGDRHEAHVADVLEFLKGQPFGKYDLMIVDPPAFAKRLDKRHKAVQGYKRLNALALRQIAPGGLLFTFSCSQVIDLQLFKDTIVAAGIEAGRQVRIFATLSQGPDHPVSLFHPEGSYLKGLGLFVA